MNTTKPTERRRRPLSTPFAAAIALAVAAIVSPAPASAESLEQAMIEAYSGNPTLLAQRAALRVLDESVSSAVAGWRPTVSLSADMVIHSSYDGDTMRTTLTSLLGDIAWRRPSDQVLIAHDVALEGFRRYLDASRASARSDVGGRYYLLLRTLASLGAAFLNTDVAQVRASVVRVSPNTDDIAHLYL